MDATHRRLAGLLAGAAALALPTLAKPAALERTQPMGVRVLFTDGTYGELGAVYTDPDLSGRGGNAPPLGLPIPGETGNLLRDDWKVSGAAKGDVTARLSWALLLDQPFVANTFYRQGTYPDEFSYAGTEADLDTVQLTGLLAFDVTDQVKLFGGLRAQQLVAEAAISFLGDYTIEAEEDWGYGYVVGAAYSRPEIGLRVALTYASKIEYRLDTREFANTALGPTTVDGTVDVDTPQSVTLEAQTGIDERTLVFGSVRWVDWSEFAIAPELYAQVTLGALGEARALVDYPEDWWTYTIGVGRQLTDSLAGSLSLTHEPQVDEVLTTLGPVDGRTTLGAALTYEIGRATLSGGVSYGLLGDTTNLLDTKFRDGEIFGAGVRVGYAF